ncbi:hypothetical protein EVC45_40525 [Paraburkholderia sp. UYCP14C]|nr:hypothetical protein EVC45_40525 [Paraburkholderia sp. UYCP14C]
MMKKLRPVLSGIDPIAPFRDFDDAGKVMSSGAGGEGGLQQRHAADLRPARLRGPWRQSRSRRRAAGLRK